MEKQIALDRNISPNFRSCQLSATKKSSSSRGGGYSSAKNDKYKLRFDILKDINLSQLSNTEDIDRYGWIDKVYSKLPAGKVWSLGAIWTNLESHSGKYVDDGNGSAPCDFSEIYWKLVGLQAGQPLITQ
ncbi:hypothetical protein WA026_016016 [Henosepilachna vigintioctopunctata]|uniref:Uncharacterized protein n=1 Tax=Henosepilachna vigintioctopunctata TaxID=420089 RepID=A0AAW1TZG1_9CUCU